MDNQLTIGLELLIDNEPPVVFRAFVFRAAWEDSRLKFAKGEELKMCWHEGNRNKDSESCYYYAGSMIPKQILQQSN